MSTSNINESQPPGMIPRCKDGPLSSVPERKTSKTKKQGTPSLTISSDDELGDDERRRQKKEKRRAKRLAKYLADLGLDENGDPIDNFSLLKYPVREWKYKFPGEEAVAVNPVVAFIGVACLWVIVMWSNGACVRPCKTRERAHLTFLVSHMQPSQPNPQRQWSHFSRCAYV
jgi:hypothetical protein